MTENLLLIAMLFVLLPGLGRAYAFLSWLRSLGKHAVSSEEVILTALLRKRFFAEQELPDESKIRAAFPLLNPHPNIPSRIRAQIGIVLLASSGLLFLTQSAFAKNYPIPASSDSTLAQQLPSNNYGGLQTLYVGNLATNSVFRSRLYFDISSIPANAIILYATIDLYLTARTPANAPDKSISLYRANSLASEAQLNWTNNSATTGSGYSVKAPNSSAGYTSWDATTLVNDWRGGLYPNNGVVLRAVTETGSNYMTFSSKEGSFPPQLFVQTDEPAQVQTPLVTPNSTSIDVEFTPVDPENSQVRYDVQLWNSARTSKIAGLEHSSLASISGQRQYRNYDVSSYGLSAGTTYSVSIQAYDATGLSTGAWVDFVQPIANVLGLDTPILNGKNVRGPILLGSPANGLSAYPWKAFYIRENGNDLAVCYVGQSSSVILNAAAWRIPSTGSYVREWKDIISRPTQLTVVGYDTAGNPFPSSPFTVTPQETLSVAIVPPPNMFPSYNISLDPTFDSVVSGNVGPLAYGWYFKYSTPVWSGTTFNPTTPSPAFASRNVYVVSLRVQDSANNNITFAQYIAPIAIPPTQGDPASHGSWLVGPVDVATGNVYMNTTDFSVPCYGIPFTLKRSYNSQMNFSSPRRWRFNIEEYGYSDIFLNNVAAVINYNGRGLYLSRGDGSIDEYFLDEQGQYRPVNAGNFDLVVNNGQPDTAGRLAVYQKDGTVRTYQRSALPGSLTNASATYWVLISIKSPRGLGLDISYNYSATSYLSASMPRISKITDASGRQFSFYYDGSGHIQQIFDPTGRFVQYTWDGNDNITDFRDFNGKTTHYDYRQSDPGLGQLTSILMPRGNRPIADINYDGNDRATDVTVTDGPTYITYFDYTSIANATLVTPPVAVEKTLFSLSPTTKAITNITEAYGTGNYATQTSYLVAGSNSRIADFGLVNTITNPVARATALGYDTSSDRGIVQKVTSQVNRVDISSTNLSWQGASSAPNVYTPTSVITPKQRNYTFTANAYGEITRSADPAGNATDTSYNTLGLPDTVQTYPDGINPLRTTYGYDIYGNLTTITDNTNAVTQMVYDNPLNGFVSHKLDRRGYWTDFTYDSAGNLLTETKPGVGQIVNTYDDNGNLTSTRDRRLNLTTFGYNNRDLTQTVSRTAPVNGSDATVTETIGYDGMGRVQFTQNGAGNTTYRYYNSRGLLSSMVNGEGETTLALTYNLDATVNTQTKGQGTSASVVIFGYDNLGRQTSITDSLGNQLQTTYNSDDQVTGRRDARGNWTYLDYDNAARLATVTDTGNAISRAFYDAIGRLTEVRDPRGNSTFYIFDDPNRRITERDHLSRSWIKTNDAEGNLITESFPDGRSFSYTYDTLGRLDYLAYGGGRFADPSYDADGNMTSLADHLGATAYSYDSLSRLSSVTDPFGQTVSYRYDAASNLSRVTYPGSKVVDYTFDRAERMKTVAPWAGGTFTYGWRTDGLPSRLTNGNGTYTDYGYDAAARLTSLVTRYPGGSTFINHTYTLDPNGNITRLFGDQPTAPPTDLSKTMSYDATNRLLTDDASNVSTDAAGRITGNPATTGGTATWEGRDWLATFTATGGSTSSYTYNGLGQRLSRTQGGTTTRYVLDVNQPLPAVLMENNVSNTPQRHYIYGIGLLASIDSSNNALTYHFSQRGDTLALTNAAGTVTESYGYSPYGTTTATNASGNPFRFVGQHGVMDEGNGLHFMRARYYGANLGKFLSRDQLSGSFEQGQTLNLFVYVAGNPLTSIDPSGFVADKYPDLNARLNKALGLERHFEAKLQNLRNITITNAHDRKERQASIVETKNLIDGYIFEAAALRQSIAAYQAEDRAAAANRIGFGVTQPQPRVFPTSPQPIAPITPKATALASNNPSSGVGGVLDPSAAGQGLDGNWIHQLVRKFPKLFSFRIFNYKK